jgi:hypothetical protein
MHLFTENLSLRAFLSINISYARLAEINSVRVNIFYLDLGK